MTRLHALLSLKQVSAGARLHPLNAEVTSGARVHVIGANGAGKTTLLARIAGILPGEGEIVLKRTPLKNYSPLQLARYRAYLSQHQAPALMSVFQYLALYQPQCCDPVQLTKEIHYICETLKLTDKLSRSLTTLSGGEWQRVRIAGSCLQVWPSLNPHASLLLLDEPMNSLDIGQQAAVDRLIAHMTEMGLSVIVSTHDLNHTLQYAQQVWMLQKGVMVRQGGTAEVMLPHYLNQIFDVRFRVFHSDKQSWLLPEKTS